MNRIQQDEMYRALVDTLTRLKADIEEDYAGEDSMWDADEYQDYCDAVGAKRGDPIDGLLISIERLINSVPLPIETADRIAWQQLAEPAGEMPAIEPVVPEYIGNLYKPAGQQRVMKCIAVWHLEKGRGKTMLGFDVNPYQTETPTPGYAPWVGYFALAGCVLINDTNDTKERAA